MSNLFRFWRKGIRVGNISFTDSHVLIHFHQSNDFDRFIERFSGLDGELKMIKNLLGKGENNWSYHTKVRDSEMLPLGLGVSLQIETVVQLPHSDWSEIVELFELALEINGAAPKS